MGKYILKSILVFVFVICSLCFGAEGDEWYLNAKEEPLKEWQEDRFGMFIHWGPVSLVGTEIGWSRGGKRPGMKYINEGPIPQIVYDNLYKSFYPGMYDADRWAKIAKKSGMKYMVLTTKHHDGFCMFDSNYTDYDIMSSPFKRDIVAEYIEACRNNGLKVGLYYSPPDWHHPDYMTDDMDKYIDYMHNQVVELCSNYGKIDIMWFDGLGINAETARAKELFKKIRELQPKILINNRIGLPGDFDTPEQQIGGFNLERPWESCITIANQWAWKVNDPPKSLKKCVRTLVQTAAGDGNLLLNVGPLPTGQIDPMHADRLLEMGEWLDKYGETIYGTRGGPYTPTKKFASTRKDKKIYIHVFQWPESGFIELPLFDSEIENYENLTGGSLSVAINRVNETVRISVPEEDRKDIDTIIELTTDKNVMGIEPIRILPDGIIVPESAEASSTVFGGAAVHAADKAIDIDHGTRWATEGEVKSAWIKVDLGEVKKVGRIMINEHFWNRVRKFKMEYKKEGNWQVLFEGERIGEEREFEFKPVKARYFKLTIDEATVGPTIHEIQFFKAEK